jgi:hypothetical protein
VTNTDLLFQLNVADKAPAKPIAATGAVPEGSRLPATSVHVEFTAPREVRTVEVGGGAPASTHGTSIP